MAHLRLRSLEGSDPRLHARLCGGLSADAGALNVVDLIDLDNLNDLIPSPPALLVLRLRLLPLPLLVPPPLLLGFRVSLCLRLRRWQRRPLPTLALPTLALPTLALPTLALP